MKNVTELSKLTDDYIRQLSGLRGVAKQNNADTMTKRFLDYRTGFLLDIKSLLLTPETELVDKEAELLACLFKACDSGTYITHEYYAQQHLLSAGYSLEKLAGYLTYILWDPSKAYFLYDPKDKLKTNRAHLETTAGESLPYIVPIDADMLIKVIDRTLNKLAEVDLGV